MSNADRPAQPNKRFTVYVLEIAVLSARDAKVIRDNGEIEYEPRIAYWEPWEAFMTHGEARNARDKRSGPYAQHRLPKRFWRIRAYIPREVNG